MYNNNIEYAVLIIIEYFSSVLLMCYVYFIFFKLN